MSATVQELARRLCALEKEVLPLLRENAELWRLIHPERIANAEATEKELAKRVAAREAEKQSLIRENQALQQRISGGAAITWIWAAGLLP